MRQTFVPPSQDRLLCARSQIDPTKRVATTTLDEAIKRWQGPHLFFVRMFTSVHTNYGSQRYYWSPRRYSAPMSTPHIGWATQRRQVSWLAAQTLAPSFPALTFERASGSFEAGSPPTVAGAATDLRKRSLAPCSLLTADRRVPTGSTNAWPRLAPVIPRVKARGVAIRALN